MTALGLVLPAVGGSEDIELAVQADAAGVEAVWLTENFYTRGAFAPAGAIAARTDRIFIGTGTVSPLVRHPATLAMEAAAMNDLSRGRFRLGVGPGSLSKLAAIDVSEDRPLTRMSNTLAALRAALGTGEPSADSSLPELDPPVASPVPVFLGASGPKMLELAGRSANGVLLSLLAPRPFLVEAIRTVRQAAAGREVHVTAFVPLCTSDVTTEGRDAARRFIADNIARFAYNTSLESLLGHAPGFEVDQMRAIADARAAGQDHVALVDDELVDEFAVSGDVDGCATQLSRWTELDIDELALAPVGNAAQARHSIAVLATLVTRINR